jgi:hypothetical protein
MLAHTLPLLQVEKVKLVNRFAGKQSTLGTLYITTSHLIFVGDASEIWVCWRGVQALANNVQVLHNLIDTVERGQIAVEGCLLTVRCKHFLTLPLVFARDRECQDVYETLLYFSQPGERCAWSGVHGLVCSEYRGCVRVRVRACYRQRTSSGRVVVRCARRVCAHGCAE